MKPINIFIQMAPLVVSILLCSSAQAALPPAQDDLDSNFDKPYGHSCKYISGYAEDLIHRCADTNIGASLTGGREFNTDNYSVYVMADRC
ncbi:hypothetical protein IFR05_016197 [Cadophora sp. M221]|nr:hypothetical protein IFR05_016197 [Cadophora sp. M221]